MTNHCCSTDPCQDERFAEHNGSSSGNDIDAHLDINSPSCTSFISISTRSVSVSSTTELKKKSELADVCAVFTDSSMTLDQTEVNTALNAHKSVRFADDCGHELATVRVMTEPSDYPPAINPSVIRRLLGKSGDDDSGESEQPSAATWVVGFKQPASEYVKFRETLERGMVALENVMLKNDICHMVGTVKVKNIAFEKRVFIRLTSDGWKSFKDSAASFQPSSSKAFDTFSFDMEIPSNQNEPNATIEFCVCFEVGPADDESKRSQYWDSNGGLNYQLKSAESDSNKLHEITPLFGRHRLDSDDAYLCDYDNWTKFASWKNLSTEGPYW